MIEAESLLLKIFPDADRPVQLQAALASLRFEGKVRGAVEKVTGKTVDRMLGPVDLMRREEVLLMGWEDRRRGLTAVGVAIYYKPDCDAMVGVFEDGKQRRMWALNGDFKVRWDTQREYAEEIE